MIKKFYYDSNTYTIVFMSGNTEILRFSHIPYNISLANLESQYSVRSLSSSVYDGVWLKQGFSNSIIYSDDANMEWSYTLADFINWSDPSGPNGVVYIRHHINVYYSGFGADSGNAPVDYNSPYLIGSTVTVLDNTGNLTKSGYTFNGWNDGTNHYNVGDTFIASSNIQLTPDWI